MSNRIIPVIGRGGYCVSANATARRAEQFYATHPTACLAWPFDAVLRASMIRLDLGFRVKHNVIRYVHNKPEESVALICSAFVICPVPRSCFGEWHQHGGRSDDIHHVVAIGPCLPCPSRPSIAISCTRSGCPVRLYEKVDYSILEYP